MANISRITDIICTFFYTGKLRPAPGTWGSLATIPFLWIVASLTGTIGLIITTTLIFIIGVKFCNKYMDGLGIHDPSQIVIDEVAGMFASLTILSIFGHLCKLEINYSSAITYLIIFISFRIFDIIKPWPIGWLDKNIKGGYGVMIDDIAAGVFSAMCSYFVIFLTYHGLN